MVMNYNELLREAVKAAVRRTVAAVLANHPDESLNGYALVTDDDLRTLGYVASTVEFTKSQTEPGARFEPVDWVYDDDVEAFDEASELLVRGDDAESPDQGRAHVAGSFNAFVDALRELKLEGLFPGEVFLTVISTDPSEYLEALEAGAVQALNSVDLHGQWKASIA